MMTLRDESVQTVEQKYPEVRRLISLGRERGYVLYEEIQRILSEELLLEVTPNPQTISLKR